MSDLNLNLPSCKVSLPDPEPLSMDDYLEFVNFCRKYTFNRDGYQEWKAISGVRVPFILRD